MKKIVFKYIPNHVSFLHHMLLKTKLDFKMPQLNKKNWMQNISICLITLLLMNAEINAQIILGSARIDAFKPLLKNKKIGLVVNQSSLVNSTHLIDTLKTLKVNITTLFSPEHGLRGNYSAGEKIKSGMDEKTGLPIISLYGNNKKPSAEQLKNVDIIIFDLQDVGARFYTYISTLHYVMEALAETNKTLIVLDKPNPNGDIIDGPVLDTNFHSFVGMHPIPILHGMTMGEYAQMINGESWLKCKIKCKLIVIPMKNYTHKTVYMPPIFPSPNLRTYAAIRLYASLCFFEGTEISLGRGTDKPFECIGLPNSSIGNYEFTPKSIPGVADNPPQKDKLCKGYLLSYEAKNINKINLNWLIEFYKTSTDSAHFFNPFFDKLAGTNVLRKQIISGLTAKEIEKTWQVDLEKFKTIRKKYVLYKD
jgi:uncharacterized protein YbbC (DUF1343 family)